MSEVLRAEGSPVDQGRAQGRALRDSIEYSLRDQRSHHGLISRRRAQRRVARTSTRALETQLPQQSERLAGIALGAGVRRSELELLEASLRIAGAGFSEGGRVAASLELPAALEPLLVLRESRPDAGGFPSVELTYAPLAGCLAGVNAAGMAVICLEDGARGEPSVRFLAAELVFRASQLDAGIDHLRRRARYLGGSGLLLIGDARGEVRWLRLRRGEVMLERRPERELAAAEPCVRIDPAARSLVLWDAGGREREARVRT